MVVWIDGTYGVGKSKVALELARKCEDCIVLESDVLWGKMTNEIAEEAVKKKDVPEFCGLLPQNNIKFLQFFLKVVQTESYKHLFVIVDMALTQPESRDYLFVPLIENLEECIHFILYAKEEEILQRIKKDENRQKEVALDYLKDNIAFLENNYFNAYRIDTSGRDTQDIAEEILHIINDKY